MCLKPKGVACKIAVRDDPDALMEKKDIQRRQPVDDVHEFYNDSLDHWQLLLLAPSTLSTPGPGLEVDS